MKRLLITIRKNLHPILLSCICMFIATTIFSQEKLESSLPIISTFDVKPIKDDTKVRTWITFYWEVQNADRIRFFKNGEEMQSRQQIKGQTAWPASMKGGFRIQEKATNTYKLVAENNAGEASKVVEKLKDNTPLTNLPEIRSFSIVPNSGAAGEEYTFYWEVKNAWEVKLYDSFGEIKTPITDKRIKSGWPHEMKGVYSENLTKTETFELKARNKAGETSETLTINILEEPCKINISLTGKYSQFTEEIGVFEFKSNGLGKFLYKSPITKVRDHRNKKNKLNENQIFLTLNPGEYSLVPLGTGTDKHGSFGVIYKPGRIAVSCENGESKEVSLTAEFAEY